MNNTNTMFKAQEELQTEINRLSIALAALQASFPPNTTNTTTTASYRSNKKTRSTRGRRLSKNTNPGNFLKNAIAESRTPLTTQALVERITQMGWRANPNATKAPEMLVYGSLRYMEKTGKVQRVGMEWTRV